MSTKVLFILKRKEDYNAIRDGGSPGLSTGLYNSASFVVNMLKKYVETEMVVVTDNNDIDREVTKHRPTHVILEALWVVPEKMDILTKLHPKVSWFVRLHSNTPFLAQEGIAMEWISKYVDYPNVRIMANDLSMLEDTVTYLSGKPGWDEYKARFSVIYTPNFYPTKDMSPHYYNNSWREIHIGCFGAVRPLKNQLIQAIAAVKAAKKLKKKLYFHINATRVEGGGNPVLKNLISMFDELGPDYNLVQHPWLTRDEFLDLAYEMDLGLQVSFTETFNIVSADHISQGVPMVVSRSVPWTHVGHADPTNTDSIVNAIIRAYNYPKMNVALNQFGLKQYCAESERIWRRINWGAYVPK